MKSLRYCRIIRNFVPAKVPMSYLCGEDFKPYILSGLSPPILTIFMNPSLVEAMPKYIPNSRFSDCWASVGNITFYHRNGQCYFRKKSVCKFPRTTGQIVASEIHSRALAAWRTLDHNTQLRWNEYAKDAPSHRPPFDKTAHITGHNLFVSAYHGFAQIGNEHIPEPKEWRPFPVVHIEFVSAVETDDGGTLRINFKVLMADGCDAGRYRLHLRMQLTSPRSGVRPGFMRTFIAEENVASNDGYEASVLVEDYKAIWGLSLPEYQVHCRYSLIDTASGYRNNHRKMSFLMPIGV